MFGNKERKQYSSRRPREKTAGEKAAVYLRKWLFNWREWIGFVLLFLVLEIAVISLEQAQWMDPQPWLSVVLILSMLVTWLMLRLRLRSILKHGIIVIAGLLVTFWQALSVLPSGGPLRLFQVIQSWWQAAALQPGEDKVAFAVFLIIVTWVAGYFSAWFLLRRRNAWVGMAFGGIITVANLSNLPGSYHFFLGLYLLAAVFLAVENRIRRRYFSPGKSTVLSGRLWVYLAGVLLVIVFITSTFAWIVPQARYPELQTALAARMLWSRDINNSPLNIFNSIPAKQVFTTGNSRQDFTFENAWHEAERVDFVVRSDKPSYWQVHTYDYYSADGWKNSSIDSYILDAGDAWGSGIGPGREPIDYTVELGIRTDIMLNAGIFRSSNTPVLVSVGGGDIVSLTIPRVLDDGDSYEATAMVASVSPGALSVAGEDYPDFITENYLQLPSDFPERIRRLAADVTTGANTPYEKVLAIDRYLSTIPYQDTIVDPPDGADPVEYFLFEEKSGFCLYFGSAMAVMLRAVDVPTRFVVGYLPGDPGSQAGEYILRDKHYHAWPQVYFPAYGWVDVEATPSSSTAGTSQVSIDAPLVYLDAINQLPQWDVWDTRPPGSGGGSRSGDEQLTNLPPYLPIDDSIPPGGQAGYRWSWAEPLGQVIFVIIIIAIAVIILAISFFLLKRNFSNWVWRVDRPSLASAAYARLCALSSMLKLSPRPQQTPLEFAAEMAAEFPEQAEDFEMMARIFVENRFGRRGRLGLFEEAELLKSRRRVFDALLRRFGPFRMLSSRPRFH